MNATEYKAMKSIKDITTTKTILNAICQKSSSGRGYICPLCGAGQHKGNTLKINPKSNAVHCFACDFNGSIIDLYATAKNVSTEDALKACADIAGITIEQANTYKRRAEVKRMAPAATVEQAEETPNKTSIFKFEIDFKPNEEIINGYYNEIATEKNSYLNERRLLRDLLGFYGLDYTNKPEELTAIGFRLNDKAEEICKEHGFVIYHCENGAAARSATSNETEKMQINTAGANQSFIFNAEALAQNAQPVFITEGAADCLALLQFFYFFNLPATAVSIGGTSGVSRFVNKVKNVAQNPPFICALDNDAAGRKANEELYNSLLDVGATVADMPVQCYENYKDFSEVNEAKELFNLLNATLEFNKKPAAYEELNLFDNLPNLLNTFKNKPIDLVKTPFSELNYLLFGGFRAGLTYTIGGQTGIGKTAFLTQIAEYMAVVGHPVFYFSLEIMAEDLTARILSRNTAEISRAETGNFSSAAKQIEIQRQAIAPLTAEQAATYAKAVERFKPAAKSLYLINDVEKFNLNYSVELVSEFLKKETPNKTPVLIVDYLQLMKTGNPQIDKDPRLMVKECSTVLTNFCAKNKIVLLQVSSLNRSSLTGEVTLNSYKEAGEIEYNTAGALLLTNDKEQNENAAAGVSYQNLKIAKARGMQQGEINLINYYYYNYYVELNNPARIFEDED